MTHLFVPSAEINMHRSSGYIEVTIYSVPSTLAITNLAIMYGSKAARAISFSLL